jgi:hypothetical protein
MVAVDLAPISTLVLENGTRVEFYEPEPGVLVFSEEGDARSLPIVDRSEYATRSVLEIYELLANRQPPDVLQEAYQRYLDTSGITTSTTNHSRRADEDHLDPTVYPADSFAERDVASAVGLGDSVRWFDDNLCGFFSRAAVGVSESRRTAASDAAPLHSVCSHGRTGTYQRTVTDAASFFGFVYPYRSSASFQVLYRTQCEWKPATAERIVQEGRYRWARVYYRDTAFDGRILVSGGDRGGFHVGYLSSSPIASSEKRENVAPLSIWMPPALVEYCGSGTCAGTHWNDGFVSINGTRTNGVRVEVHSYLCHPLAEGDQESVPCDDSHDKDTHITDVCWTQNHPDTGKAGYYRVCNHTNNGCHLFKSWRRIIYKKNTLNVDKTTTFVEGVQAPCNITVTHNLSYP